MELVLALEEGTHLVRVTCDDSYSHTFDLRPLLVQKEQEILTDPAAYGSKLFRALFPPDTPAHQACVAQPERILLVAMDPQLDAIAWEYTYGSADTDDPAESFLVLECPFVRGLPAAQRVTLPQEDYPFHIVAVPSNPLSAAVAPLAIEAEWTRLKETIQQVPYSITLERTTPPTLEQVRQQVANRKGRVMHFMGHGGQDPQRGALLCFEQDNGALHLVTAKEFMQRVRKTLFLVTLNACVSATPGPTPFHNLAAALVRQKTPYALGMRVSILDEDARTFSRVFYHELARGVPVEEALFQARLTLAKSPRAWVVGVPVLYTALCEPAPGFRCPDGTPTITEARPQIDVSALPPVEGTFQGRLQEMLALGTDLTGDQRPRLITIVGSGGQGKTALVRQAGERFAFAWPGGVWAITLENLPTRATFVINLARFFKIETQDTLDLTPIERKVLTRLNEYRTLLILDNAETLIEAVEAMHADALDLVEFLKTLRGTAACLLVTSRVALGWDDEKTYELGGLSPQEGAALFRQGAPQRQREIDPALAESLSRRLEGHPLGLRLLAGAFNDTSFPLPAFLQVAEERLREAENKYVGPAHRHRKLYACIETSVRSLDLALRSLLSGLWLFHAPFLVETAVAIFDPDTQETELHPSPVRDHLYHLWRRSLLTRKTATTRDGTLQFYVLLPTTRPYVELYMEQAYERELLTKRFIRAYSWIARYLYEEVNRSTVLAQHMREDLEWVCEALEQEETALEGRSRYLFWWGSITHRMGNPLRGLKLLERGLEAVQGTDSNLTVQISNTIALIYSNTGRIQEALNLYEETLLIIHKSEDCAEEALTLNNTAAVYYRMGSLQEALKLYEEALPIVREMGNHTVEAATLNNMAATYYAMGCIQEALKLYEEALPITQEVGDRAGEAGTLNNIALIYSNTGRSQEALRLYEEALPIVREVGNHAGEATTLNNIAVLYSRIGYLQEALRLYEEVLPIVCKVGDRAGAATTLNNIALIYSNTGRSQEALNLYEEVLPIMQAIMNRTGEATTLNNMAAVYHAMGYIQKALKLYEETLSIMREVGDRAGEAGTLNNIALIYSNMGQLQEAFATFEQSLSLSQQVTSPATEITGLIGLALLLYGHLSRPTDAITSLEQALHIFAVTGLSQDAAGQTVELVEQLITTMRNRGTFLEMPSTPPPEVILQIVTITISVMSSTQPHRSEWYEVMTNALKDTHQRIGNSQHERDFFTAILAFLDGQSPTLPADHPYAQAVEAIQKGIAPTQGETV